MRHLGKISVLALAFVAGLASASLAAGGAKVGVSAAVRGDVSVKSAAALRPAKSGEAMFLGDVVASKSQSGMQILLLDETNFTIGADCQIVIDTFVYDPASGSGEVSATVSKGALRYVSGLVSKDNPEAVKLKTPSSTIGLRGTSSEVIVGEDAIKLAKLMGYDVTGADPRTATIVVLRGPGSNRTSLDRRGQVVVSNSAGSVQLDKPGFGTFVPAKNVAPLPPVRLTDDAERALQAMLSQRATARAGGAGGLPGGSAAGASGQTYVEGIPVGDIGSALDVLDHDLGTTDNLQRQQEPFSYSCSYGSPNYWGNYSETEGDPAYNWAFDNCRL